MGQTFHVYPVNDLIEHDTDSEDCVCGPTHELVPSDDGNGWIILHHSLDGREAKETS